MSEAVTSAGTSWGCCADEVLASDCSGCAVRLLSVTVGRPPYCRRVSFRALYLMRHKEKRRCSPTRTRRERGADVPGPKSGVHGLWCFVREETTSTTVVLWSRVLMRRGIDEGSCSNSSWALAKLDVDMLTFVPPGSSARQTCERWHSPARYTEDDLTCGCSGCVVRLLSMTVGWPRYCRRVSFGAPALLRR